MTRFENFVSHISTPALNNFISSNVDETAVLLSKVNTLID